MNESILNMSRGVFKAAHFLESLISQASAAVTELKEIKELLLRENEQGKDTQLLTMEEAAEKLKVSMTTMFRWRFSGELLPIKIGCGNYYRLSDIIKSGLNANDHEEQTNQP